MTAPAPVCAPAGVDVILDVDPVAPPLTGIGNYALELARRLPSVPGMGLVRFAANGAWITDIEARRVTTPRSRMPRNSALQTLLRPVHRLYRIGQEVRQTRAYGTLPNTLFHGTNFTIPDFPGRSIATIHDLSVLRFPQFHPAVRVDTLKRAIEKTIERASFLIADSEFIRGEIVELLSWPPDRVRAVHLGVGPQFRCRDSEETAPVLAGLRLHHGRYALCIASIEPRKNIDGIISAYAALPPALKAEYPLVLAGHPGWNSGETHQRIRRLAGEGWLKYIGYVADATLPHLISGARGFVYPSFYEGFGLPVVEAMASGVPVVTSNGSSLAEVAEGAALLVDPLDREALTAAIRRLLEDDEWRDRARQSSLVIARRYSWDATVLNTAEVYRHVNA